MMKTLPFSLCTLAILTLSVFAGGCWQTTNSSSGSPSSGDAHDHDGHEHGEEHEGPHGGHVIELGRNHEYHAELVENEEAGTVTIYMLDKDLKELAIDAPSIVMNLTVDGQAQSFELTAANASDGKASRFEAAGRDLFDALHEHQATGKLRVTIDGTPHSGDVEHHDHDDEDHTGHNH